MYHNSPGGGLPNLASPPVGHNSKRMSLADHTIGSDIDTILQKVNINSAFLGLAKNDNELVEDMKKAIVQLWN